MSASFDFKAPDYFTAGALGPPGQRVFYLQAREAGALVTLQVEKEHVGGLAEYIARLLAKLPSAEGASREHPLLEPVRPAWVARTIAVAYDEAEDRVLVVAEELVEDDAAQEAATARFRLSREQAAALVERARALMKAGRPPCPICGRPKDPDGHVCPRSNGHSAT